MSSIESFRNSPVSEPEQCSQLVAPSLRISLAMLRAQSLNEPVLLLLFEPSLVRGKKKYLTRTHKPTSSTSLLVLTQNGLSRRAPAAPFLLDRLRLQETRSQRGILPQLHVPSARPACQRSHGQIRHRQMVNGI